MEKRILSLSKNKLKTVYNSTRVTHYDASDAMKPLQADLDEPLTLINVLYAALISGSREISAKLRDATTRKMAAIGIEKMAAKHNETLLLNMTAREALIGRPVPILGKLAKLAATFGGDSGLSPDDAQMPQMPDDKLFGFASITNNTWQGPFEVFTGFGVSAPSLGDLISFAGKTRQRIYSGACNRLQASAGELRSMPIAEGQVLEMYRPELCRVLRLEQHGSTRLPTGVAFLYKFASADFASGFSNKANRCYCYNSTVEPHENYCSLEGVIEPGPCAMHAPLVISIAPIEFDARIKDSIANWNDALVEPKLDDLPELRPNVDFNMLVLRRLGVPVKVDVTVVAFVKVRRDPSRK